MPSYPLHTVSGYNILYGPIHFIIYWGASPLKSYEKARAHESKTISNSPKQVNAMFTMLDLGSFFLFISGFLMIRTAYKDRDVLTGYNFIGSLMLAIGISFSLVFYLQEGFWVSTLLTMPNYLYWIVVVVSLLRKR